MRESFGYQVQINIQGELGMIGQDPSVAKSNW